MLQRHVSSAKSAIRTLHVNAGTVLDMDIAFNPETFEVVKVTGAKLPSVAKEMQTEAFRNVLWSVRARIFDTSHFNYSLFPIVPVTNVNANCISDFSFAEVVDTELEEGPGYAVCESSPLQALTFWWLAQDAMATEGDRFTARVQVGTETVSVEGTTITAFTTATSSEKSDMVLRMFAVPYADIRKCSDGVQTVDIAFHVDAHHFGGSLTFNLAAPKVTNLVASSLPIVDPQLRADYRTLWWQSRVIITAFPSFCVNNEPSRVPRDTSPDPLPCVRSGNSKRDLFMEGPGYSVTSSPTLRSIAVWWLEEGTVSDELTTSSSINDRSVDTGITTVRGFTSLTGMELSPLVVRMVQIPFKAIREVLASEEIGQAPKESAI